MKWKTCILWDVRFQIKYGFYLLYGLLTLLYLLLLHALPAPWRQNAAAILILSDPAAMGMFFMGAIVLLEKSQRVPWALAASPVSAARYTAAKTISLSLIALVVAGILAYSVSMPSLPQVLAGTLLCSFIFTLLGIVIAARVTSLNQFILWTVPVETVGFLPAILHLFRPSASMLQYWPTSFCIDMIVGKGLCVPSLIITLAAIALLFPAARQSVQKMWNRTGGAA